MGDAGQPQLQGHLAPDRILAAAAAEAVNGMQPPANGNGIQTTTPANGIQAAANSLQMRSA